jgi:twinkle protein
MAAVISPDDIDFALYLTETEAMQRVRPASGYIDEMLDRMFNATRERCAYLPWDKTREAFQFRPGEVTLWPGINGHGKSLVTGMVSMSLMGQREKVCIASFEMKPYKTLERMSRQWLGYRPAQRGDPQELIDTYMDAARQFGEWTDGKLWLYDQQGTTTPENIVSVARYCAKELGIQHIFIDSLMKCVKNEDDYNGQKYVIDEFCSIAKDHNAHIHVIHHSKKLDDENRQPGKFDSKGSGSITDQVDNIMVHWRNKAKENARRAREAYKQEDPDAMLICHKQRNGEDEPKIALWFDPDSQQFTEFQGASPMNFSEYPHVKWAR